MPNNANHPTRNNFLRELYRRALLGQERISVETAKPFLEAIYFHRQPATCIQRLVSSEYGCPALQTALSFDVSHGALNGPIASFIHYLQSPEVTAVCGGEVLRQVLLRTVEAQGLWAALVEAAKRGALTTYAFDAFSWLLFQLVSLPVKKALQFAPTVQDEGLRRRMLDFHSQHVRERAQRIISIVSMITTKHGPIVGGPGGRHDNDFADIRQIAFLPTSQELASENPFLPRFGEIDSSWAGPEKLAFHIDRHFRLLREDMLRDVRQEIQIAHLVRTGKIKGLLIDHLSMSGILCDGRHPWSLLLRCTQDLPRLPKYDPSERMRFLLNSPNYLMHESVVCLMVDDRLATLGTLMRDEELLVQQPPTLCVRIPESAMETAILRLKTARNIKLLQLSTAFFAYESVLKQLKEMKELPFEHEILSWAEGDCLRPPAYKPNPELMKALEGLDRDHSYDLSKLLKISVPIRLDISQASCFLSGLRQRVSLIQGPPGTGKSFIGSLIAKAIYECTREKILVVCYTHHALDQFLEELLETGVPEHDIVRLGSIKKATARTQSLALKEKSLLVKLSSTQRELLAMQRKEARTLSEGLRTAFAGLKQMDFSKFEVLDYLEQRSNASPFFEAFKVPEDKKGTAKSAKARRTTEPSYLLDRWYRGKDAGVYQSSNGREFSNIWNMRPADRLKAFGEWKSEMLHKYFDGVQETATSYDAAAEKLESIFLEKDLRIIRQKRIIACTTTAAAKYKLSLQSINPGVLLVEEAGEILESHILTALGPETKQMILIGDHKQLRPRCSFDLSVEKGIGYDLNRSMFERLVLQGYPHKVLLEQHRMRPEVSSLVRHLTYPNLIDAPNTIGRPDLRGFRDNLIFMNHEAYETHMIHDEDWTDATASVTKQNEFEAKMAARCVKYLKQQGYDSENIVVLTPYLGQLRYLHDELSQESSPVINDLDTNDMVRNWLIPPPPKILDKPPIRLSTVDSFQGDEGDVVVASLTRSNDNGEIGFMASPQRLNVLLSRAREALILIGNVETFEKSRDGGPLYRKLFSFLREEGHMYDGLPVRCETHRDRTAVLYTPDDFEAECPDGGCSEPCGVPLRCGVHLCPKRCHQNDDHATMICQEIIEFKCVRNHLQKVECHRSPPALCPSCEEGAPTRSQTSGGRQSFSSDQLYIFTLPSTRHSDRTSRRDEDEERKGRKLERSEDKVRHAQKDSGVLQTQQTDNQTTRTKDISEHLIGATEMRSSDPNGKQRKKTHTIRHKRRVRKDKVNAKRVTFEEEEMAQKPPAVSESQPPVLRNESSIAPYKRPDTEWVKDFLVNSPQLRRAWLLRDSSLRLGSERDGHLIKFWHDFYDYTNALSDSGAGNSTPGQAGVLLLKRTLDDIMNAFYIHEHSPILLYIPISHTTVPSRQTSLSRVTMRFNSLMANRQGSTDQQNDSPIVVLRQLWGIGMGQIRR